MIKIRCFFSAAGGATGSKRCCGKVTVSCCCTNAWIMVPSDGRVRQKKHSNWRKNSTGCWCRGWRLRPGTRLQKSGSRRISCSLCRMLKIKKCKSHQKTAEASRLWTYPHAYGPPRTAWRYTDRYMWMVHPASGWKYRFPDVLSTVRMPKRPNGLISADTENML